MSLTPGDALAAVVALGLALAHLLPPALTFLRFVPRSWVLSAAGGISVSYVFLHLLPDVAEAQSAVDEAARGPTASIERHAWIAALVGLLVFYGLERSAVVARRRGHPTEGAAPAVFWLSIVSFAVYNAIVGYLLVRRAERDPADEIVLFGAAMALHFVINDLGLRHHYEKRYDRIGRPVLVTAILAGWAVGLAVDLSEAMVGLVIAFLAGGIVLNVLKEEVPEERESRFLPLAIGAVAYGALVLLV